MLTDLMMIESVVGCIGSGLVIQWSDVFADQLYVMGALLGPIDNM